MVPRAAAAAVRVVAVAALERWRQPWRPRPPEERLAAMGWHVAEARRVEESASAKNASTTSTTRASRMMSVSDHGGRCDFGAADCASGCDAADCVSGCDVVDHCVHDGFERRGRLAGARFGD